MLRFIVKHVVKDQYMEDVPPIIGLETYDIDVPELESILLKGGQGLGCCDRRDLIGVEFLPKKEKSKHYIEEILNEH